MILGNSLGKETLSKEFKEFRFEMIYDLGSSYEKIYKNPDEINKWILRTIQIHVKKYFMKYIQGFNNSSIEGDLYFGVSDEGEIIGYPIHKNDFDDIRSMFKFGESENVKVSFQKVDIENFLHFFNPSSDEFLEKMEKLKFAYESYKKDFDEKKKTFIEDLEKTRLSINELIKTENKLGFIDYLNLNNVSHLFPKDISKDYPDSVIKEKKRNPDHILFWATRYRDKILDAVIERKPKWDYSQKKVDPYYKILLEFKPMVDYLLSLGYSFYVIHVHVKPTKAIMPHDKDRYFVRKMSEQGEPCCMLEKV